MIGRFLDTMIVGPTAHTRIEILLFIKKINETKLGKFTEHQLIKSGYNDPSESKSWKKLLIVASCLK